MGIIDHTLDWPSGITSAMLSILGEWERPYSTGDI